MKNLTLPVAMLALFLAACSSSPKKDGDESGHPDRERNRDRARIFDDSQDPLAARREERRLAELSAEQLYRRARGALDDSDFSSSIENYEQLINRHPYSPFATQGAMERIYALYRAYEPELALSAADRFLREHPRHPEVDYIYYLKGLINFHRDETGLTILPVDVTKSDITSQRRAFDDFALLIQRFPDSKYVGDAYDRMVYIRNRIAEHELHVVDFYVRRGAYVAAAKRAEQIIGQYPGTPASYQALKLLAHCYELAGLDLQAQDARKLLKAQKRPTLLTGVSSSGALAAAEAEQESESGLLARIANFFSPTASDASENLDIALPPARSTGDEADDSVQQADGTSTAAQAEESAAVDAPQGPEEFFEPDRTDDAGTSPSKP